MKDRCGWCTNRSGKTEIEFGIIDENFGQYVHNYLINYCPFCGRYINRKKTERTRMERANDENILRGGSMKEYIERQAAIDELLKGAITTSDLYGMGIMSGLDFAVKKVADVPAADVVEVVHAKWNDDGRCTNCGGHAPFMAMADEYYESPYCFECGAKMDKKEI